MDTIFEGTNKHSILTAEASTIDRIQRLSLSLQTDGVESSIGTWPQSTWMTSPIERLSSTSNLADHSIHISSDAVENPPTNELRRQSELILPHHNQEWIKARRQLWQAFGNWINY